MILLPFLARLMNDEFVSGNMWYMSARRKKTKKIFKNFFLKFRRDYLITKTLL